MVAKLPVYALLPLLSACSNVLVQEPVDDARDSTQNEGGVIIADDMSRAWTAGEMHGYIIENDHLLLYHWTD